MAIPLLANQDLTPVLWKADRPVLKEGYQVKYSYALQCARILIRAFANIRMSSGSSKQRSILFRSRRVIDSRKFGMDVGFTICNMALDLVANFD